MNKIYPRSMQQSGDVDFQATSNFDILELCFYDGRKREGGGCQSRFMNFHDSRTNLLK